MAFTVFFLPVRADAAPTSSTSAEFTVPATGGYTLDVRVDRGILTLTASQNLPPIATISTVGSSLSANGVAATTYSAPASGAPDHPQADLGPFGHIDVAFRPSGQTRVTRLDLSDKTKDCDAPRRIVRNLGTFTGTISFHGENGYTSVEAPGAEGSLGTSPFRSCSTKPHSTSREGIFGQAGPDVFLNSSDSAAHTYLSASTLGAGAGFFAAAAEPLPGGLSVVRTAEAHALGALTFDPVRRAARFRPPAPFSGKATYRRGASHPWSGSLAVDFPGMTVPLTGSSFKARMRLAE